MSFLLKNRETLTELFTTFSLQEILLVNQNLHLSWHLLTMPPAQLLLAMNKKQVSIEHFLGKKCLPLIRFYLSDRQVQKKVFLSKQLLVNLFTSLPPVEATIFKEQIQRAQLAVQQTSKALDSLLSSEGLTQQVYKIESVVQLDGQLVNKKQSVINANKIYLNCFYYLQGGELYVVAEGQAVDNDLLLYSELSPLQQLQAQKLCNKLNLSVNNEGIGCISQPGISA